MAQLTVRKLDDELVQRLKLRAVKNHRSAEAEHRAILETALRPENDVFWRRAGELRDATRGRRGTDSAILVRHDRDRQGGARR